MESLRKKNQKFQFMNSSCIQKHSLFQILFVVSKLVLLFLNFSVNTIIAVTLYYVVVPMNVQIVYA